MEKLDELTKLQKDFHYEEIWSGGLMRYKEEQLKIKLTGEPEEPPHVLVALPGYGQGDVLVDQPIQVVFDWPMEPASVEAAMVVSPAVDYTTTWLEANFVLLIEPATPLATSTSYTIEIGAGPVSTGGIPLEEPYSFDFTTGE